MSKELDIPLVATNDVHYIKQEDAKAHDVLLCIQTGKTVDDDRSRERQNEDKDPIDYKRLGREMGKRPIYVSAKLNDREVVKMTAKPMKEQMDNDEKIRKMLKGEPVWA